ncbi:hypothetical protein AB835_03535 [Candidatus Endobugula sertula]|uniref:Uncharacterized protein n=1 Tax=Candidatus Endobugula sertula TaxID=62101 RepID=A0A1D2QSF5_9GAMM|nr:hypothetical protein AB835_03535 [Candidatus Endobugula sertula]
MDTYPIIDTDGLQIGFEIENVYISDRGIFKLLSNIIGVDKASMRKIFKSSEYVVEFQYQGVDCVVWVPYDDSSRYWIGPQNPEVETIELGVLQKAFDSYTLPFLIKLVGDILSLKFIKAKKL